MVFCMVMPLQTLPQLKTERLRLRPLAPDDAEAFRAMTDEPVITDVIHFLPTPFQLPDARRLIAGEGDGRDCFWGVWLGQGASLIGTVGTHLHGADEIEIGYWFASSAWGRGFGVEAVSALIQALSAAYPARRIIAECRPQNAASWRLLEKIGFQADGHDGFRPGRRRLVLERRC